MRIISGQLSDKALWDLLRKGNKNAFSVLYQRHIKTLLPFGLKVTQDRELIKDTLQELFIEFWNNRATLSEVSNVKVYLIKSFQYKLMRASAQANKSQVFELDDLWKEMPMDELLEEEQSLERQRQLKNKLQNLPEQQRKVIHLRYFQNLKNEEIAEILDIEYQSVANLLHRAVKNLKKQLIAGQSPFSAK